MANSYEVVWVRVCSNRNGNLVKYHYCIKCGLIDMLKRSVLISQLG